VRIIDVLGNSGVIASIAVAIATAAMAWTTCKLGKETKRAVDEPGKRETKQAFQSLFRSLQKDIIMYDGLYCSYGRGNWITGNTSYEEAAKGLLSRLAEINSQSTGKIDNLLEKILLDSKLLQRILEVESLIKSSFQKIEQLCQTIEPYSGSNRNETTNQLISCGILNIGFRLRQLACYFICEAELLGYKELANKMRKVQEFEPNDTMQQIENFRELGITPEPGGPYVCCTTEKLVEKAIEKVRQNQAQSKEKLLAVIKDKDYQK